jgi:D-alanine transaminase
MTTVYLNGEYVPREQAMIPADDRGFIFGDGIYEGVRSIDGKMFEWDAHAERMVKGLTGLRIEFGAERVAALQAVCERLVRDNGLTEGDAFLYLQVTRGSAPRTHHFPPTGTPETVYIVATRLTIPKELREKGAKAVTYPDLRWQRCDWKTVNLLGSVLARQVAVEHGAYEAVLMRDGIVTEGAATNVFGVVNGVLRTHPLNAHILPGITRQVVVELIREHGFTLVETPMTEAELRGAEELFLCGTSTDVTPIVTLDGQSIAGGIPGPITVKLRESLEARLYQTAGAASQG